MCGFLHPWNYIQVHVHDRTPQNASPGRPYWTVWSEQWAGIVCTGFVHAPGERLLIYVHFNRKTRNTDTSYLSISELCHNSDKGYIMVLHPAASVSKHPVKQRNAYNTSIWNCQPWLTPRAPCRLRMNRCMSYSLCPVYVQSRYSLHVHEMWWSEISKLHASFNCNFHCFLIPDCVLVPLLVWIIWFPAVCWENVLVPLVPTP